MGFWLSLVSVGTVLVDTMTPEVPLKSAYGICVLIPVSSYVIGAAFAV